MYVKAYTPNGNTLEERVYKKISNLSFAPEVDITGQSLPVNELYLDIHTEDEIPVSNYIKMYDDSGKLWAKYFIVSSEKSIVDVVSIRAESFLGRMDRTYVPAVIYTSSVTVASLVSGLFNGDTSKYYIDSSLQNLPIVGYFPKQTKKERLQWICFAIGAYVKTFFTRKVNDTYVQVEILPLDNTVTEIPASKTFWRPSLTHNDWMKNISIDSFSFTLWNHEDPPTNQEYVEVDGSIYTVTRLTNTVTNQDVPSGVDWQEIEINDVYIVPNSKADDILSRLALIYFKREKVNADIVNNAEFEPAHKVTLPLDSPSDNTGRTVTGFIDSCDFSFGIQARARISMTVQSLDETTSLTILYENYISTAKLGSKRYNYPVGVIYQIENPYLDKSDSNLRYVYYPVNQYATGEMAEGQNVNHQGFLEALVWQKKPKILNVLSVDSVSWQNEEEGVLKIE